MKLAVLADPLDNQNAGVHVYTKSMLLALDQRDDDNEYLIIRESDSDTWNNVKQIGLKRNLPFGLSVMRPWVTAKRIFWQLPRLVQKHKVDVVLEPAHFGPFGLKRDTLSVTFIHDITPLKFPNHHRWLSQKMQNWFLKNILKNSDLIITNSQYTKADLNSYFPFTTDKSHAILLGKDPFYSPDDNIEVLKQHGLQAHQYFLNVGTIEPRKNLTSLLEAYRKFREHSAHNIPLAIAGGKGWKTEAFDQALQSHPYKNEIKLLGYVDKSDMPALYSLSSALIYPSLYEGFGFPILEAMACGAPVICSNTSSMPEVGGEIPYYISPTDIEALFKNMLDITQLTREQREDIKARSIARAQQFSWDTHAAKMIDIMQIYLNKKRQRQ